MRASSSTATATTEASTSASTTSRAVPHLDVLRVSQVDAARLDGELVDVLGNQLTRVVDAARATTRGRATDTKSTREMRLALDLALFACTTGVNRATPGQELMNFAISRRENDDDVSRDAEDWCGGRRFERGAEIGVRVGQVCGGVRVGVVAEEDVEGKV